MSPRLLTTLSVLGTLSLISIPAREAQPPNRDSAGLRVAGAAPHRPVSMFERNARESVRSGCTSIPVPVRETPVVGAVTPRPDDENGQSAAGRASRVHSPPCAGAWTLVAAGPPVR